MLELVVEASKSLSAWPVVNAFFLVVIAFLAFMAMRRGDRDRKTGKTSVEFDMPAYMMVHDAAEAIKEHLEETRKTNAILSDLLRIISGIDRGQSLTHELLTQVFNSQEMRTTVAPTGHMREKHSAK